MRRTLAIFLAIAAICCALPCAKNAVALAANDEAAVLQADNALQQAFSSKNAKAIAALLDQSFTWTDESGRTRKRAQFLQDSATGNEAGQISYSDVKANDYGQLAIVTGTTKRTAHPETFFARIWVKRPSGWLLLTHQETAIIPKPASNPQRAATNNSATASDCENPCRFLPYKPKTAAQAEVVKAYQAVETAVTSHDAKTWADHVADEFVGIGRQYTGTPDTKAGRVGQIGITSNHVVLPKMLWGEAYVFGDAAILIADHQPVGEPPYHVIRVWVNRDGRWQLFHRQETTIKKTPSASGK